MKRVAALLCLFGTFVAMTESLRTGTFWHFTDTHELFHYAVGTDPKSGCHKGTGEAGPFGHPLCDVPPFVVASSFAHVVSASSVATPAFLLWTGDIVPHNGGIVLPHDVEKYLQNVTDHLKATAAALGGHVRVFPLLGNHDSFPEHRMAAEKWWTYESAAKMWSEFLNAEAAASMAKYGRYVEKPLPGLRLLAINTVLYYAPNSFVLNASDPGGQFAWIREQLTEARAAGDRVYIAGHLPPGWEELATKQAGSCILREDYNDLFISTLDGFHDVVAGSFWGHVHVDSFKLWKDATSMSPIFLTPSLDEQGDRDPAVRLFTFNSETFDVLDYDQWGYHVNDANTLGSLTWKHIYNARNEYKLEDLTAKSIKLLHNRLKDDDALFLQYYRHLIGHDATENSTAVVCNASCKHVVLCAMAAIRNADNHACVYS